MAFPSSAQLIRRKDFLMHFQKEKPIHSECDTAPKAGTCILAIIYLVNSHKAKQDIFLSQLWKYTYFDNRIIIVDKNGARHANWKILVGMICDY